LEMTGPRFKRLASAAAVAGAAAMVLAGCTTSGDDTDSASGDTITIAVTNAFTSFNGDTPQSNLDTNGMVGYLTGTSGGLGLGGFLRLDASFENVYDESFGTIERVSEDPLSVKYTLNEGLTWSD